MAKSFKRVIACILAVLMVCFSMPFTALATPEDYQPNFTLRFGTFSADDAYDVTSTDWSSSSTGAFDSFSGIKGPALDYTGSVDEETGAYNVTSLTLDNSKVMGALEYNSYTEDDYEGELEGTTTYEEGMGITMSVLVEDIDVLNTLEGFLTYSDNIEPAYVWTAGKNAKSAKAEFGTAEDYAAALEKKAAGDANYKAVTLKTQEGDNEGLYVGQNMDDYYADINSSDNAYAKDGKIYFNACKTNGYIDTVDISKTSLDNDSATDPETGETGYDFAGKALIVTFAFIITGDVSEKNPITIGIQDTTNIYTSLSACDTTENMTDINQALYPYYNEAGVDAVGGAHVYFQGYNCNSKVYKYGNPNGETTHTHTAAEELANVKAATCTEAGYTGDVVCKDDGEVMTAGEATDPLGHDFSVEKEAAVSATCTTVGKTAVIGCSRCDETTGGDEVAIDADAHSYELTETVAPTCTEKGYDVYTCKYNSAHSYNTNYVDAKGHTEAAPVIENQVAGSCKGEGTAATYDEVVYCSVDGVEISRTQKTGETPAHTPAEAVKENEVPATEDAAGSYDEVVYCSVCGDEISRETKEIPALGHTHVYTSSVVDATCTAAAYTVYTCTAGDDSYTEPVDGSVALGHNFSVEKEAAVTATCVTAGKTALMGCSRCDETTGGESTGLDADNHEGPTVALDAVEATCQSTGLTAGEKCSACGVVTKAQEVTAQLDHNFVEIEAEVPATKTTAGKTAVEQCTNGCNETKGGEVIPALGIVVTVDGAYAQYGEVEGYEFGENTVDYLSTVTLTAKALDGAKFVGWEVSGKQVSTDATYSFTATSDVTVTPIFADTANDITVVFLDKYNNVSYSYAGSVDGFVAEMKTAIPTGTNYPGYTFNGWDLTDEEILAITDSTVVNGVYTATGNQYKVTLNGTGTIDGENVTEKTVGYDTSVTVKAEGATAWSVDGANVAYGDTYTFFVGADITVTPVFDTVTAKPEVGMVKATATDLKNKKVNYLATMTVEDGYKLLDHGFVYVADKADASTLTLDNVGNTASNGKVVKKVTAGATGSKQFALNYSVKTSQYGSVVAYIVYQAADGTVTTEYTTPTVVDYTALS
jgi:hypothetical protein